MLFIFLIMAFSLPRFSFAQDYLCEAQKAYDGSPKKLTTLGRLIEEYLLKNDMVGTIDESIFIKNNPDAALALREVVCRAWALSYGFCGIPFSQGYRASDEEADAIRHFIFSSGLACSRGKKMAEEYTVLHEGPPSTWKEQSQMDIYNNYQGFEWADPQFGRCYQSDLDKKVLLAALKKIKDKKLKTLVLGDTECRHPQKIIDRLEKMSSADFANEAKKYHAELHKLFPTCK